MRNVQLADRAGQPAARGLVQLVKPLVDANAELDAPDPRFGSTARALQSEFCQELTLLARGILELRRPR